MTLHSAPFARQSGSARWQTDAAACLFLAAIIGLVFGQVGGFDFVFWDDLDYVKRNPLVLGGISPQSVWQAFTTIHAHNWHPLTWVTHMVDVELFGLQAGWHHLMNVGWHLLAAVLLYRFLADTTGETMKSLLVATLFAVHPLHVESVAWVSERKDVLSAVFWFATLLAYSRYARTGRRRDYALSLALFAMGLTAKPMLVTLPAVLLLVDIWPLGRLQLADRRLLVSRLVEKLPFVALSVASAGITVVAQQQALISITRISLPDRVAHAIHGAATYLWQAIWPVDLIFFYPIRELGNADMALAASALMAIAVVARMCWRRDHKAPAVGVAWYAISLLPVIGLVQVGNQAHADRYTYLPLVGIFTAVCWSLPPLPKTGRNKLAALALIAATIAALAWAAWKQTSHWKNGAALMAHALDVDPNNNVALVKYGEMRLFAGDLAEAESLARRALAAATKERTKTYAHELLASVSFIRGDVNGALMHYRLALEESPTVPVYHYNLGVALLAANDPGAAIHAFETALRLEPEYVEALINLGVSRQRLGNLAGAIAAYRQALAVDPANATARLYLARRLRQAGDARGAIAELEVLLAREPNHSGARAELSELLESQRVSGSPPPY